MEITAEYKDAENKLMILYLVHMMDLPMSRSQITDFFIDKQIMNCFTVEQNLTDMVERGFLDATNKNAQNESSTSYTLTEDGVTNLDLFDKQIPRIARNVITRYIEENRGKIKKCFEKTADYFPNVDTGEYDVKLEIIDNGAMLMQITVPVITREQAKHIQSNWNENYNTLYQRILLTLTEPV